MLKLDQITKEYVAGDERVLALKGVSLQFRESEFVSILGPSGCGKTTLLNIIGGLDQYTGGDLVINGRSTRQFHDRDWDAYRNHSIGFVFQSYNLIPHQSVLANVELALTLSGVGRGERRRRAIAALEKVGLGSQLHKRPNQMSGGQMQRVAIARALVNEPSILLADEPTGALDTETSVQIMELLKEIARDRLVIMVTHNPELADRYSTRIIRLLDGRVIDDSDPYSAPAAPQPAARPKGGRREKTSMSVFTALSLSLNNLLTKKTRTLLTAFAGSIGIIGIALILALSNGIQTYIDRVQEDTLSSYPVSIEAQTVDMSSVLSSLMGAHEGDADEERQGDRIYSSTVMYDMLDAMSTTSTQTNNLKAFKAFLDTDEELRSHLSAVQYTYDLNLKIYTEDPDGKIIRSDLMALMETVYGDMMNGNAYASQYASFANMQLWEQMLPGEDGELVSSLLKEQYDVLYGHWPTNENEVVLFVNENNELSDMVLYALGLKSGEELSEVVQASLRQEPIGEVEAQSFTYEELCGKTFQLLLPSECYQKDVQNGAYRDLTETDTGLRYLYDSDEVGRTLRIVGILRPNADATASMMGGAIGYTTALTQSVMQQTAKAEIVRAQLADPTTDVLTGLPFASDADAAPTDAEKAQTFRERLPQLSVQEKAEMYTAVQSIPSQEYVTAAVEQAMNGLTRADIEGQLKEAYAAEMEVDPATLDSYIAQMSDDELFDYVRQLLEENVRSQYADGVTAQLSALSADQLAAAFDAAEFTDAQWAWMYDNYMPPTTSSSTFEENCKLLGWADESSPASIQLYAATFADKDAIADCIARYNEGVTQEADEISYTDYVALLMSSITTIINAISYVLIAFVAISLVVSSIMIGIITYISVLERTKEIGILRAIGASRQDVSRVFNAETLIVGLTSGLLGIGLTLLITLPVNALIRHLTGISSLGAALPVGAAAVLVAISMLLTVIAGLIPSRLAAKKDPVVALRSE